MAKIIVEFRDRRDTAANWATKNPILEVGEHGYEIDSGRFKIGDGVTRWNDNLQYFTPAGVASSSELTEHISSEAPHPVYDDGPSLFLLYQNAKV